MAKTTSATGVELGVQFDEVRKTLLQAEYADRLAKPLQYWVLPSDRRLPLALLGRTVGDLLSTPFEELSATPGIGQKKIWSMVKLLDRATKDEPPLVSFDDGIHTTSTDGAGDEKPGTDASPAVTATTSRFNPSIVSEALWAEWREKVRESPGVADQKLGRMAPSLQRLPTVIWHTPLRHYLDHTVAEIRNLRTHGEKRVRCVLEVFHSVYHRLDGVTAETDLEQLLMPSWIQQLETWEAAQLKSEVMPSELEVSDGFVKPLMSLIEVDCGPTVLNLVQQRLGIDGVAKSVREQARSLGVTRARVYQLLDDCAKVMTVRWPDGKRHLDRMAEHFSKMDADHRPLKLFFGLRELCFPEKQEDQAGRPNAGSSELAEATGSATSKMDLHRQMPVDAATERVDEISLRPTQQGASVIHRRDDSESTGGPHVSVPNRR